MRKYLVLVIAVLLAAVLFIRYLEREDPARKAPLPSAQEGAEGVPLPPDARTLSLPEFSPEAYQPVSRLSGTAQQPAPEIIPFAMPADACLRETKVKDVIAGYNKTWGLLQKDKVKTPAEQVKSYAVAQSVGEQGIKDLVARVATYQVCLSLAADKDLCGGLPKGGDDKADGKADLDMRQSCKENLYLVGLIGYSLGKSGHSYCSGYFKNELQEAGRHVKESEFCEIAKGGLSAISGKFCAALPPEMKRECLVIFPKDISGCKNEENCVLRWRVYEAVKNNSPENLSYGLRPLVSALIDKKEEHCRPLTDSILQEYCSMKSSIDQRMMQIEMGSKQAEMDKALRSARETQSAD